MTLDEIKAAVDAGKKVHWSHAGYIVHKAAGDYLITCTGNQHTIGLTWLDGVTMNGKEEDFFIASDHPDEALLAALDPRLVTPPHRVEEAIREVFKPTDEQP
jgi:hypothetical protein